MPLPADVQAQEDAPSGLPKREELFDLYKIAIDEYRFEVQLNWDRTRYYFLFNSATVGVATGLLRLELSWGLSLLVGFIFFAGLLNSCVGVLAIRRGHEYYRNTVYKKTLLEFLLGYLDPVPGFENNSRAVLAIGTTFGQQVLKGLLVAEGALKRGSTRRGNVTTYLIYLLVILGLINFGGCVYVAARLFNWAASSSNMETIEMVIKRPYADPRSRLVNPASQDTSTTSIPRSTSSISSDSGKRVPTRPHPESTTTNPRPVPQ